MKLRDDLPLTADGKVDTQQWLMRVNINRVSDRELLEKACDLLSPYQSSLRQGLMTAEILVNLEPDLATLLGAMTYFAVYQGYLNIETLRQTLNDEVRLLVEGMIQIMDVSQTYAPGVEHYQELRQILLSVVEDVRVILIKLAERITILRQAKHIDPKIRQQYALEARDIYAGLANRLGIGQIKWELEDFAFRYLEPSRYKFIANLLKEKRKSRENDLNDILLKINEALKAQGIEAEVRGRVKHIYSIWRKMHRKNLDFDKIHDIRAVRILTHTIKDCYDCLHIIHHLWESIEEEFDDYIARPKENGYRSLHTALRGPGNRGLEVQIRTFSMHQEAELGVAAHWLYKEDRQSDEQYQRKLHSIKQFLKEQMALGRDKEKIYVFTPQGDVFDLPQGSTPLDFAYHIHINLGHSCRGALVNERTVPLTHVLNSGDKVNILAIKAGATPLPEWLDVRFGFANSSFAKSQIQAWFEVQEN